MVEAANKTKFSDLWLSDNDYWEKTDSVEKLRLNGVFVLVCLCVTLLMYVFFPASNLTMLSFLAYFLAVSVFIIRFILIDVRRKKGSQND